ncbi:MAG: NAD/NADP octopine/nopaline dehydrogenase family protein [Desulfotignum sp.]|nr:NAD/NADP octopine/nopaline dehydrogenase family protein [Desulfotignum sp.]MCF8089860.1 NAD/NADP octopine/nopaline dehydrogenase family protein [Desulfotignum sp.]MCF8138981.1 NAD/NADP octopine/nopaline dehydrogenase family protein [Desulfotignum sp.]
MGTKLAVIGAGNGGFAISADLGLAGFDINLYEFPEYGDNIAHFSENTAIEITGNARVGTYVPDLVTTDIQKAIAGAKAILVATQAKAHDRLIQLLGPYLKEEQVIYLFSGYASSIRFSTVLKNDFGIKNVLCADVMTLPYACRKSGPTSVDVLRRTGNLGVAAFPADNTDKIFPLFEKMYPPGYKADNVMQIGLCNQNIILHPTITIMNAGAIERYNGKFNFYEHGCTPSVETVFKALDKELLDIFKALGFPEESSIDAVERRFELPWEEIQAIRKSWTINGFNTLNTRFITEDVPEGLVFMSSVGQYCNVPTPVCDAMITLADVTMGQDYRSSGRTMETMGLSSIKPENLHRFLTTGDV